MKSRVFDLIAYASVSLCLSGCANNSGNQSPADLPQPYFNDFIPEQNDEIRKEMMSTSEVSCRDKSTCPESIAMLTVDMEDGLSTCTAFLVAPNIMVTNSHCIPHSMAAGDSCGSIIYASFPDTDKSQGQRVDCDSIIGRSINPDEEIPDAQMDFAFIKLKDNVTRDALSFDFTGLHDQAEFSIYKVNPMSKITPMGEISTDHCRLVQKTLVFTQFDNDLFPVGTFLPTLADSSSCNLVHGNSGAPMVDSAGHVRALFQGMKPLPANKNGYSEIKFATNFACVRTPLDPPGRTLPSSCGADLSIEKTKQLNDQTVKIEILVQALKTGNAFGGKILPQFEWVMSPFKKSFLGTIQAIINRTPETYHPIPLCLKDTQISSSFPSYLKFDLPTQAMQPTFDQNIQVESDYQLSSSIPSMIELSKKANGAHVKLGKRGSFYGFSDVYMDEDVPPCSQVIEPFRTILK